MVKKDWFRLKRYPHIGLPLKLRHRPWIENYIFDKKNIAKHSFYPFIHRKISVRKFRKVKNADGTKSIKRESSYKDREVFYANHLDSMIYGYYSDIITKKYEKKLIEHGIKDCVSAYRSVPLKANEKSRNKCNIDFANDIFKYIEENKNRDLIAITFDITSFFDNLNHKRLKETWIEILDEKILPDDHYAIFKNLTKFSYIEQEDIFEEFKDQIIVDKKGKNTKISIPNIELLKEKNAIAFCSLKDFNSRIRAKNLIKKNRFKTKNDFLTGNFRIKGIPQGSPISSTLANIYLLHFDKLINEKITEIDGMYRRYSDDMIVVADEKNMDMIYNLLIDEIQNFDLEIQPSKSQSFIFKYFNEKFGCKEIDLDTGEIKDNTKFEYLGFSFDGEKVYLKSSGLAKYYRKMKRSIKRGGYYAKFGKNKVPQLFKNRLYKRYTIMGAHRRKIIKKAPHLPNTFYRTNTYDWGNFLTYAKLAANVFENNGINSQIGKHWDKFHNLIKDKEVEIENHYANKIRK
ncbi:reverse transcriptase domain-containing protein [Flavobacterium commune]|uniref:Reverse transcriptase domain-containing protein n=1 Tax=Flavobacterium commune TaxID=1306519 RepID=A0A1D9PDT3_9FLAO|nr:reverse transcriptase domain-containing protein [Flavobacterium commune]APA00741.1 hypothetical protein BIW12_15610 [Flavobacterium commune]